MVPDLMTKNKDLKCEDCGTEYEVSVQYCPIDVMDSQLGKLRLCDIEELPLCDSCYRERESQT